MAISFRLRRTLFSISPAPTPAGEILPLMTLVVRLPALSAVAGRDMWARIRAASPAEIATVTRWPVPGMPPEEGLAHFAKLPPEKQRKLDAQAESAVEAFLRAVVLEPPIASSLQPLANGSLPYEAVRADRFALVKEVLVLSGTWPFRRRSAEAAVEGQNQAGPAKAPALSSGGGK
jgi:hypothetical protein